MSTPPISKKLAKQAVEAVQAALKLGHPPPGTPSKNTTKGAYQAAADKLGVTHRAIRGRIEAAERFYQIVPDLSLYDEGQSAPVHVAKSSIESTDYHDIIRKELRNGKRTAKELAEITGLTEALAAAVVADIHHHGFAVAKHGDHFDMKSAAPPAYIHGAALEIVSDDDGIFKIGAISDTHLCSKYCRLDVLNAEYDRFKAAGCTHVLHAGNWVDGEASFNKHDLLAHGMDAQIRYMAEHYPRRDGLHTYAVAGDDHEGWWAQREGVDVGRYAERIMHDLGRDDWHDLGYMESHVKLTHKKTGASAILAVVHPGGGSSYADSYAIQKIIEILEGGTKPAVALYGHYHKMLAGEYRNVWWLQTGCTQDQTPFARKKKLRFVLGGTVLTMKQNPTTGAIDSFLPDMKRYFNAGYYQNRWSHSGDVQLPGLAV